MEILGYIASVLIGICLGLIGSGGSILTVPVLVYLFGIEPVVATSYSLFIVGITAVIGSVSYFRKGLVRFNTVLIFGLPSVITIYLTRVFILPAIPDSVFVIGSLVFTKGLLTMLLFAILMLASSYHMIRPRTNQPENSQPGNYPFFVLFLQGAILGFITGLVGVGGGFLIIPVLVIRLKMQLKEAVGTSLVIITINSLIGFLSSINHLELRWEVLLSISFFAIIGIFIGIKWSKKMDGAKLKPLFGWFVLCMGIYILLKEIFF